MAATLNLLGELPDDWIQILRGNWCNAGLINANKISSLTSLIGGEGGIRTLGTRKRTTVFETAPFDHSGTSPFHH